MGTLLVLSLNHLLQRVVNIKDGMQIGHMNAAQYQAIDKKESQFKSVEIESIAQLHESPERDDGRETELGKVENNG